jgi:hypothetical protein
MGATESVPIRPSEALERTSHFIPSDLQRDKAGLEYTFTGAIPWTRILEEVEQNSEFTARGFSKKVIPTLKALKTMADEGDHRWEQYPEIELRCHPFVAIQIKRPSIEGPLHVVINCDEVSRMLSQ